MSYNVKKEKQSSDGRGNKFRTFEDLEVYQGAREFRKKMYSVTQQLPDFEKYDLGSQIRRAAVSLTNNIAEGHGRYHFADQVRFFLGSRGSLQELVDDLNVNADENYLEAEQIEALKGRSVARVRPDQRLSPLPARSKGGWGIGCRRGPC
jgi:four helix bundle protein